jgi:group I intron endonuclease
MGAFLDCGTYVLWNTATTPWTPYVGSAMSFRKRWKQHIVDLAARRHVNVRLQRAWNKYGSAAFEFEVLAYCPEQDLLWHEQMALDAFGSVKSGYNICPVAGSSFGTRHSVEAKAKIAAAGVGNQNAKGKKKTAEWYEAIQRRNPEFNSWCSRKALASRRGIEFIEPRPETYLNPQF